LAVIGLCVISIPQLADAALLMRNYMALLGLFLLMACVSETPVAALSLGVLVVLYAYIGSQSAGEPRPWAWLLRGPGFAPAWWAAGCLFAVGSPSTSFARHSATGARTTESPGPQFSPR
jgi:hypothetical protein